MEVENYSQRLVGRERTTPPPLPEVGVICTLYMYESRGTVYHVYSTSHSLNWEEQRVTNDLSSSCL
jgi:hypothetical protein